MIKAPKKNSHHNSCSVSASLHREGKIRAARSLFVPVFSVAIATLIGTGLMVHLDHRLCLPVYLLAVVYVSTRYGYIPSLLTCLLSLLAYEYFLSPPIFYISPIDVPVIIYFTSIMIISVIMSRRTIQIQELVENLESQVEIRTHELSESNEKLVEEVRQKTKAEAHLRDALHRLVEINAQLRHFHKVAAHDLREPLRTTKGYMELIQRRFSGDLNGSLLSYLQEMSRTIDGMENLIDGIKCLTDAERASLEISKCSVSDCAKLAIANLSSEIKATGATITLSTLPEVCADKRLLLVLFQNLLSNSLKFCRKHPEIKIHAKQDEEFTIFSVSDNGIGIDDSYKDQVFKLFSRLNSRTEFHGNGIGLSLCRSIVKKHGGEIWFDSEPGRGSTFSFSLPNFSRVNGVKCNEEKSNQHLALRR